MEDILMKAVAEGVKEMTAGIMVMMGAHSYRRTFRAALIRLLKSGTAGAEAIDLASKAAEVEHHGAIKVMEKATDHLQAMAQRAVKARADIERANDLN